MQIEIQRDLLLSVLGALVPIADRRHVHPILSHILINASGTGCRFVSSDLSIEMDERVECNVLYEGVCALPARKLFDICRALPAGVFVRIQTQTDDATGKARVTSGKSRFALQVLPGDSFPYMTRQDAVVTGTVDAQGWRAALSMVSKAMPKDDARAFLNGVLMEIQPGAQNLRMVATDGHRLACKDVCFSHDLAECNEPFQAILPADAVTAALRISMDEQAVISLSVSGFSLSGDAGDGIEQRFTSKLLDAKYPDYRRVIPSGQALLATFDRAGFKSVLLQSEALAAEKSPTTSLTLANNQLTLRTRNESLEDGEVVMDMWCEDDPAEISFNSHYLRDVEAMFPDAVSIEMRLADGGTGKLGAVFSGRYDEASETKISGHGFCVLMPVRD